MSLFELIFVQCSATKYDQEYQINANLEIFRERN